MTEKRTGAIILAAGKSDSIEELKPMMKLGKTTMIQKVIDTLRQAGVTPIVVVTGYQAEELERHIAHRGAVCVRNKKYETSQMFDSICLGLKRIGKKDRTGTSVSGRCTDDFRQYDSKNQGIGSGNHRSGI